MPPSPGDSGASEDPGAGRLLVGHWAGCGLCHRPPSTGLIWAFQNKHISNSRPHKGRALLNPDRQSSPGGHLPEITCLEPGQPGQR